MKSTALAVLFATTILLTGAIFASSSVQYADAAKGKGVSTSAYGSSTNICGLQLCSDIPGGKEAWEAQKSSATVVIPSYGLEQKGIPIPETVHEKRAHGEVCDCSSDCNCDVDGTCTCSGEAGPCMCGPDCNCGDKHDMKDSHAKHGETCSSCSHGMDKHDKSKHGMKTITGTIQSETDPGLGHEQHQLAVLLAPSEKMYKGMLTYSASENVQLVALHGPLTDDEVMGQTIWTPDGKTKFALTLVDQENKMGSWMFTGNALAAHTFNDKPFSMSYSVHYAQVSDGHGEHESCECAEGCSCDQGGNCICSGEAGPCMCGPNCTCGDSMKHGSHDSTCNCGEDGTCSCGAGCTCSMENCSCSETGECTCGAGCNCSGISSHGDMKHGDKGCCGGDMKHGTDGMCSSCGMSGHDSMSKSDHKMKAHSGTIQSETDPGLGHEQHQLAVLLPPSSDAYAGLLTYSASENVQLVALHGPLTDDEVMGQTIWTPDGKTKFALTLVDQENKMGSWMFTGNALAAHTFSTDSFDITYSIVTMGGDSVSVHEKRSHGATCNCAADCTCDKDGVCTCSGEAGPCMCGPDCNCVQ